MKKRLCSTCKINEPRDKKHSNCKSCHNEYQKAYYKNNPEKALIPMRKRKAELLEIKAKAKNVPCMDCGIKYPSYVMDFDHRGDKKFELATLSSRYMTIQKLIEEIEKCDVVCANCHRERTFNRI